MSTPRLTTDQIVEIPLGPRARAHLPSFQALEQLLEHRGFADCRALMRRRIIALLMALPDDAEHGSLRPANSHQLIEQADLDEATGRKLSRLLNRLNPTILLPGAVRVFEDLWEKDGSLVTKQTSEELKATRASLRLYLDLIGEQDVSQTPTAAPVKSPERNGMTVTVPPKTEPPKPEAKSDPEELTILRGTIAMLENTVAKLQKEKETLRSKNNHLEREKESLRLELEKKPPVPAPVVAVAEQSVVEENITDEDRAGAKALIDAARKDLVNSRASLRDRVDRLVGQRHDARRFQGATDDQIREAISIVWDMNSARLFLSGLRSEKGLLEGQLKELKAENRRAQARKDGLRRKGDDGDD